MTPVDLMRVLAAPAVAAAVVALTTVMILLRYLNQWRRELLKGIAVEVKRDLKDGAPEVRVMSPLVTESSDPFVRTSVCDLHHGHMTSRVNDLNSRVERLERKLDEDVKRLHERVDELPQRILELLKPLIK